MTAQAVGVLPRTEVEAVADAVWALVQARIVQPEPAAVRRACRATGITTRDLRAASIRADRGYSGKPRPVPVAAPRPTEAATSARRRPPHRADRAGQRWCTMCKQWQPEANFRQRADRPGQRKSFCKPCEREYQAGRYLTVEKARLVEDAARIVFELRAVDAACGLPCANCAHQLKAGDEVMGNVHLAHVRCPK